ncbi:hypothetical protein IQ225_14015 [Synechocystis salina LEGE 06155]|nr:hypothetical protein [Synechocystis salina LEGE 06155]
MTIGATTAAFDLSSDALGSGQGVAGSASFTIASEKPTGVATAAAVGHNVASAWSLSDSANNSNSAGSMGTAGVITVDTTSASTTTVTSSAPTQGGTLGFDLNLGGVVDTKTGTGSGVAGSGAFTADDGAVTGVATAAAVGEEVAGAWSFNTGSTNSAGAMGSLGALSIDSMTSSTIPTLVNTATETADPDRTLDFGMDLGGKLTDTVITAPVP